VQPDLIVLCNPAILVNGKVRGAPDLVVEILSPSTAVKDKRQKLRLYEVAGVPQYLVIDPANFLAECYQLGADGHYSAPEVMGAGDTLTLQVTPGFTLTLSAIFGWPLPLVAEELSAHYG
jgi:Uma2 family endonuclease